MTPSPPAHSDRFAPTDAAWLAGAGSADITGEPWGVGMMGYGMRFQRTTGIHLRQRARAFVFADPQSGDRVVLVVADIGMFFRNVREAVLARLDPRRYRDDNVVLTATHTHAGVGGYSCYRLYNMTMGGFRPNTFSAIVDGVVASIERAEADLAPARLRLARGELRDASVNRSPQSFARNPDADRAEFPDAIDPRMTLLRIERDGRLVGAVNWFATHGTSLCNRNTLISGDNKGYAAWRWEQDQDGLVAAFAQTNSGDMSPNVPDATCGPTPDDVENARIIGQRQYDAALALATGGATDLAGGVATRIDYVDLSKVRVDPRWTPDGKPHQTSRAVLGAAFAAGTKEGPGDKRFHEGADANPGLFRVSRAAYRLRPRLGDAQEPKAMLMPVGRLGWTADVLPIQLVRLGPLVLVAIAQEVTIVAALRLRRAVAATLSMSPDDVLVLGYANDYAGYVTTPEEYTAQRYEGGHTMFGRWQLPAYLQEVTRAAGALDDRGGVGDATAARPAPAKTPRPAKLELPRAHEVSPVEPAASYAPGDRVDYVTAVADPRGRVRPSYLLVERETSGSWIPIADDGDWATTVEWHVAPAGWTASMTWRVPDDAAGTFRICYVSDGERAESPPFTVTPATAQHAAATAPGTGP